MNVARRVARLDASLRAELGVGHVLVYEDGGAPADDRPSYVRAASGLAHWAGRFAVIQDDVNVVALVEPGAGGVVRTDFILLPRGAAGARVFGDDRGNKSAKMDLESCATLADGRLVAFGSGSTTVRDRIVVLGLDGAVRVVDGALLYAAFRQEQDFSGSELNIEGVVVVGERVRFFQRGNGAPRGALSPINATCDLPLDAFVRWLDGEGPVPALESIVRFDLGAVGTCPFGFTDATVLAGGRIAFLACAEASPDTVRDGAVVGSRFGIIDGDEVRTTGVLEADGRPTLLKLEGLESRGDDGELVVVADMDRPGEPSLLMTLHVTGA